MAWWDVQIKVFATAGTPNEDVMISIDKDVLNRHGKALDRFPHGAWSGNRSRLRAIG